METILKPRNPIKVRRPLGVIRRVVSSCDASSPSCVLPLGRLMRPLGVTNTLLLCADGSQCKFRHPKYKLRHPKYKFRHPKYNFRHPKYKFKHPKYKFRHPKYSGISSDTQSISSDTQSTALPGSQVINMDRFPVFRGSQIITKAGFPLFPGSQVLRTSLQ